MAGLRRIVDAETAPPTAGDHREAIRLSGAFHVELARLSGNPLFVRMLEELLPTTLAADGAVQGAGRADVRGAQPPRAARCARGGQRRAAATEMRRHLSEIERSLDQPTARRRRRCAMFSARIGRASSQEDN